MKKHYNSLIRAVAFVLSLTVSLGVTVSAAPSAPPEPGIQLYFVNISSFSATLSISTTTGKATGKGVISLSGDSTSATLMMELQQYKNNDWTTITTWSPCTGSGRVSQTEEWYVAQGYQYRVLVTAYVYNSTGALIETQIKYSETVSY